MSVGVSELSDAPLSEKLLCRSVAIADGHPIADAMPMGCQVDPSGSGWAVATTAPMDAAVASS